MENAMKIGIDVGSTTLKIVALGPDNDIVHKIYRRHNADFNSVLAEELERIARLFPGERYAVGITGSAGMGISERTGIPFVQEVVASVDVVKLCYPGVHVMVDLGGEDAKMVFLDEGRQPDIRMNGSCAGGTGAFIDQMADLMNIPVDEMARLALDYKKIYPIASRCGVFAKTDVQNLISRNAGRADIAMSIFNAVAMQCVTTLARGRRVEPKVICVGGPLTFIPALREAFREIWKLPAGDIVMPENGEFFPAWGAAVRENDGEAVSDLSEIVRRLSVRDGRHDEMLPALFSGGEEYLQWKENRRLVSLRSAELRPGCLDCYLGIDSGSTTTKILVTDTDTNIVFSYYAGNEGSPLRKVAEGMGRLYAEMAAKDVTLNFLASAVTGYGEELVRSALGLDFGIVETMAHLGGAQYVDPQVSFILDIGGQDMKSMFVQNGAISSIELNEACSSGCGSFLQNFAATMGLTMDEFTRQACLAQYPSDLGTRCTVFMNSKVKQALRENASLGDISAGLAYSVVKNCLFKVLKINNLNALGDHIVVQGGTFRNDSVYRALELLSGKSVSSTDCPEMMGALGAALYARKMHLAGAGVGAFTGKLPAPAEIETREVNCSGCPNRCQVQRFRFPNGNISFAGNKCEKIFYNKASAPEKGYNGFEAKNRLLFNRTAPECHGAPTIGIPRVLNMYENYPFWHTLLTGCGFNVALSPESTVGLYRKGVGNIMSDNICFPAKLVHGHIIALAEQGVDRIFYPIVIKERKDFARSNNSFNCPVVSGYPDVVRSSMDPEKEMGTPLDKPVITFSSEKALRQGCLAYVSGLGIGEKTFDAAFRKAMTEHDRFRSELRAEQRRVLVKAVQDDRMVFVVAGRPYHADILVNQKTGQIISDLGIHVVTDDFFCDDTAKGFSVLKIVSQWSYPNRVVQAAMEVAKLPANVQFVQLNSFGCGPDSFFMDETGDILKKAGKNHTVIRIDEIASPGSVRLRVRSFAESLRAAGVAGVAVKPESKPYNGYDRTYGQQDRSKKILVPWLADFISPFIPALGELAGYRLENLPRSSRETAEVGLRYGHNEVCYPSTLVTGDIIAALQSGQHDLDDTVVAITQTGGQCRATNYVSQIKTALQSAGFGDIPVLVLATGKSYQNEQSAFRLPVLKLTNIAIYMMLYGDALNQMLSSTVIREKVPGTGRAIFDRYIEEGCEAIRRNDHTRMLSSLRRAVSEFNAVEIHNMEYRAVGLVGEIFVKYNDYGQAYITRWLRERGMEVMTPPILDFVMQYFVNYDVNIRNGVKRGGVFDHWLNPMMLRYMNSRISRTEEVMQHFRFYRAQEPVFKKAEYASEILDLSNQFGEGWSVAAEVACYSRAGIDRVVCVQPFGCIANHIVAKGVERRLRKFYPDMNLLYLDVDGGTSEVNLQNRLYFLIREDEKQPEPVRNAI